MAVTDMTESLPWWARQSSAPAAMGGRAPQGGSQAAWLQYLMQMNGIANPADMPSPDAMPMEGALSGAVGNIKNFFERGADASEPPAGADHGDGPTMDQALAIGQNRQDPPPPDVRTIVQPRPQAPPPGPQQGPPGYLGSTGATPPPAASPGPPIPQPEPVGNYAATVGNHGSWPTPGVTGPMAAPAPAPASPVAAPAAAAPAPAAPVPGPMANNNRFIGIDAPNANPQSSMRSGPQGTALNLAGLFGGGKAAAAPVAGPLAQGGAGMVPKSYPGDNWDIDAQGSVVPAYGPLAATTRPPKSSVARARILAPDLYG